LCLQKKLSWGNPSSSPLLFAFLPSPSAICKKMKRFISLPHIFFFPFFPPLPRLPPIYKKIRGFLTEMWASLLLDGSHGNKVCSTVQ
jgi:hypothetical protein